VMLNSWFKIKSYVTYRRHALSAHGLHSPFLFDFYNEVIHSKKEFYFFKDFRRLLSNYKKQLSQEDALFLFRWSVFYKPNSVRLQEFHLPVALALAIPSKQKHLSVSQPFNFSVSEKEILAREGLKLETNAKADLLYCSAIEEGSLASFLNYNCVVLKNPHETMVKQTIWNKFCLSKEVSISIDLFRFGILLFDKNQAKQHFIVRMS
jgi:hypothetical protein